MPWDPEARQWTRDDGSVILRINDRDGLVPIDQVDSDDLVDGFVLSLVVLRGLMAIWALVAFAISARWWARPIAGFAVMGALATFTLVASELGRRRQHHVLLSWPVLLVEFGIAVTLIGLDPYVYEEPRTEPLGAIWPLAGILTISLVAGARLAGLVGLGLGCAGFALSVAVGEADRWTVATTRTAVVYAAAGLAGGYVADRMRTAERGIALARARDEVARTLHDGVLQTLAVIQRRSPDAELVDLARSQESELRQYLTGSVAPVGDLESELRLQIALFEQRYQGRVSLSVAADVGEVLPEVVAGLSGAVGEALTNAAKHGAAEQVVVFVEPEPPHLYCSVVDQGTGFDTDAASTGLGLTRSIRGRIEELGGRVEIRSDIGEGTEVELWVPLA